MPFTLMVWSCEMQKWLVQIKITQPIEKGGEKNPLHSCIFPISVPPHSGGIFSIIIRMPAAQGSQALTSGMFGVW